MNVEVMEEKIESHERRLNSHSNKLDRLEVDNASFKTELKNLCEILKSLTTAITWTGGTLIVALIGFFIYAIEKNIFK